MKKRKTIIHDRVFEQAEEIFDFIKRDSPQNAQKFRNELQRTINEVEKNPTLYAPDRYANEKRNMYRFTLVMKSWKLVFKVTQKLLFFLGIIHTSRHPNQTKKLRTNKYD